MITYAQEFEEIQASQRALVGAIDGLVDARLIVTPQYIPDHGLHITATLDWTTLRKVPLEDFAELPTTVRALAPNIRGLIDGDVVSVSFVHPGRNGYQYTVIVDPQNPEQLRQYLDGQTMSDAE